ncbi:MAG TPA: hypothetical protein VM513_31835 [Kofleriaceae bacterium]|nr:hypothetical protein [Kofleriaceae bacterium]
MKPWPILVVAVLACASCKDKKSAPAATTTESGSAAAPKAPPDAAAEPLPAECLAYKAAIEKLASCDALPVQTRDALKQAYDAAAVKWATVPATGRNALANTCKAGADALAKTLTSCK